MADNHSKEVRSMNMSHIRSKNTKPEELVSFDVVDIGDIGERFPDMDAICTDPPYGRSTKTGGEDVEEIYRRAGKSIPEALRPESRAGVVLPHPAEFPGMELEGMYVQRVHGSLSRHYHVFKSLRA